MSAFHGDSELKKGILNTLIKESEDTGFLKTEGGKSVRRSHILVYLGYVDFVVYRIRLGIPAEVAEISELIFHGLPDDVFSTFPVEFIRCIRVGSDLELVWPKFVHWIFFDEKYGLMKKNKDKNIYYVSRIIEDIGNKDDRALREWYRDKKKIANIWFVAMMVCNDLVLRPNPQVQRDKLKNLLLLAR